MAPPRGSRVLVASDGLAGGSAALAGAARFPWPGNARLVCVVARPAGAGSLSPAAALALERALVRAAEMGRRVLTRHRPGAEAMVVDGPPPAGLLRQARRPRTLALVLSPYGRGAVRRFLAGSVCRAVLRASPRPVLLVRGRIGVVRHLLIGVDGSAGARRAVAAVAGLPAPPSGRVTLVRVLDPARPLSLGLLPAVVRKPLISAATALERAERRTAESDLDGAMRTLTAAGWNVSSEVRLGVPLLELLDASRANRADAVVVGARGSGGVERLLLGSVASGLVDRSTVPVLVVSGGRAAASRPRASGP